MSFEPLERIDVLNLFPDTHAALLDLLRDLSGAEWNAPTACEGWTVKDVAAHMLGDAVGLLSRKRDGFQLAAEIDGWESLVAFINELNDVWVRAARRMSPRVIIDLLAVMQPQVHDYFASLDPGAPDEPVGWAGSDSSPTWLHTAREYTEYWLHQQHIRDAVNRPGLKEPRFFAPLIATFLLALPHAYRNANALDGARVQVIVTGESGGEWNLIREGNHWALYRAATDSASPVACSITTHADTMWRLATKGITPEIARRQTHITGEESLALPFFTLVAILA